MESIVEFFAGFTWEQLIGMLLAVLFGIFPGVNLFQWLKDKFGVEGQSANYLVIALSIVVTTIAMLVTGSLDLEGFEFSLANILELAGFVYAGSQIAYQAFKAGKRSL